MGNPSQDQGRAPGPPKNTEATRVSPDIAEQRRAGSRPDGIASLSFQEQPVVGLGGSAGCLAPLQSFFAQMPADSGLAFVVVLHLSPEHESILAELLQQHTKMLVTQVRSRVHVKPNHVYVIPPGKHLTMVDGHLSLSEIERERGKRVAVDLFFRTLADTHGPNAVAVVLSGADSDGAIGVKRIKERGGLTVAQDPQEAEHFGMPRAAMETGMIDWVLRAGEMPARILDYRRNGGRLRLPAVADPEENAAGENQGHASALRDILAAVKARTGRDFSTYKQGTILRRIGRRMQVNAVTDLAAYHAFLRTNPGEVGALLQDLLISVTNFFRDRDTFTSLEAVIPELFKGKAASDTVRVWVPACATGEEAYSIAILLAEYAARLEAPPRLQIFATDIHEAAIAVARTAQYPETIVADVSEERLRRFFIRNQNQYRVTQSIREVVLFAMHDILRDAPFAQLDLVSCRNLLIYLNRDTQRRCFDLFHFALRQGGHLFLGTSETAEDADDLFSAVHKKHRIYVRRAAPRHGVSIPAAPSTRSLATQAARTANDKSVHLDSNVRADVTLPLPRADDQRGVPASEIHFKLIEAFAPPSVVVDRDARIVHLSPSAGRFLHITGGEPSTNLVQLVHPMLRVELRAALFRAKESPFSADVPAVPIEFEMGKRSLVDISVRAAANVGVDLFLVVFKLRENPGSQFETAQASTETEGVVRSLEREIELLKQQLRSSAEQHGATAEEMKASNEELQAMNEELRSSAEELETSREELQSMNEELKTVNLELRGKIEEVGRANSDLQNLMAATNIATIFVDDELHIKRYTHSAVAVFHLIPSDVGRPLIDLRHRLESDTIVGDAAQVLATFTPSEREMRVASGRWYLVRLMPYRSPEEHVIGVVLTFVDITERKRVEDVVRESEARFRGIVDQTGVGIGLLDRAGRLTFTNPRLRQMVGMADDELRGKTLKDMLPAGDVDRSEAAIEGLVGDGASFQIEQRLERKKEEPIWVNISVSGVFDGNGRVQSCIAVIIDVTPRKEAEAKLREAKESLEQRVSERTAELKLVNQSLRSEITERQHAEEARTEMARAFAAAQETERGRISRELHDEIGQHVTALRLGLDELEKVVRGNSGARTIVTSLHAISQSIGEELHEVALKLRPTALDDLGLVKALDTFLGDWAKRAGIEIQFDHASFGGERLAPQIETALYRVVCEAVHNACKHAETKLVSVVLQRSAQMARAIIEDHGRGFEMSDISENKTPRKLGLLGMRERLSLVGGKLEIESKPGRGTTVIACVPLPAH